ncbi:Mitochondrial distribution and morphology protein 12 [Coemansia brasiliensis]|uniref:1-phosphatidylinositol-3-phosphate 5-kinase n=1 Tax=Coemansia brasiliensis TaxID=2650707 RepID=A0A9W8M1J6_9FUNG|nr:Mitochondrial distribution and morphology protein 12 [Coemansia brasiliensis]
MFGRDGANGNRNRAQDSRSQFLRTLYNRAAALRSSPQTQANSVASSNNSIAESSRSTTYSMLGNLRRAEPQATVELARPAPEVEFSRVADVVRPVLRNYVPATASASLLSLQANQQQATASNDPPLSSASLPERNSMDGATSSLPTDIGAGDIEHSSDSGTNGTSFAYFSDERDIPFRSNAVEIAAQDDKCECAFLSFDHINGDAERARSILPLLVGQPRPTTEFGSELPSKGNGRVLERPLASRRLLDELENIDEFNCAARDRVHTVNPGLVMAQLPLQHLQAIIRQLLDEIDVPVDSGWDNVVRDLTLNALSRVRPNVQAGEKMDLRHYVRIKRIPGGQPSDSQYISGIVFTKNLAHRLMPRFLHTPRIMLLTMSLEYSAQAHMASRYVSFDDELRMQQGFTEKLVQRITGAAPDLVLSEKPVPRQVLEGLMRNKISVAHGVKRSVIRAVARCTGAEIVTSMEKFSDYPRIGTCASLTVQTYEDPSLPEFRKSFFFLDGCIEQRGGTIVLRGDTFDRLADIKQVVDLVICLSYSMVLETSLLVEEYAIAVAGDSFDERSFAEITDCASEDESLAQQALNEYNVVLSSSPCVRIPPPHVLVCMREKELAIRAITEKFGKLSARRKDISGDNSGAGSAGSSTGVSFLVLRQQSAASANRMQQQYESELALHESYIHEGKIFLRDNPHIVSLWDFQSIAVTYMVTCRKHDYMLCAGPQHHIIPFYTGTDATLGEYLEMCFVLTDICPTRSRRCAHPMYEHRHSYLHNNGRVDVTMDEYPCPIERMSEVILMWSECTRCHKRTPVVRMSSDTWCYSFGKYLEITFYNKRLLPRARICDHDLHKDFVRCFTLRNMVVRFSYSEFPIWSIATPTMPLYFNMDISIRLKEEEAAELRKKMDSYYVSLLSRLDAFPLDLVYADKVENCSHVLHSLSARASTEQVYFQQMLEQTLRNTHPADTLVIVVVYEALQGKVLEWNLQFSELVRSFIQLDATHRNSSATAAKRTTNAVDGGDGAPISDTTGQLLGTREIDSLEIIDELHSAAEHHCVSNDLAAHDSARFDMPQLGISPSDSTASLTLADSQSPIAISGIEKMSRLHRRLSIKMMRQERERQERLQEKHRRTAELNNRNRFVKGAHKSKQSSTSTQHSQHMPIHPIHGDRLNGFEQKPTKLPADKGALPNDYSTARLIGHIATDVDDVERIPRRQTEFPELRGRKGKGKKYGGLLNRSVQPLAETLANAEQSAKNAHIPPTRIPAAPGDNLGTNRPSGRPIPTRPHHTRSSNIPLPPNVRSRAASPTDDRNSSNVFLRLARRLNNRGHTPMPASLGTMPRKMNLLLPAAAQYISQQPKRPSTPQVRVFYTKPASGESSSRKDTPPRRHSYQLSADVSAANSVSASSQGTGPYASRHRGYSRHPNTVSDSNNADTESADADDQYGYRYRSATVSQVPVQHPGSDSTPNQSVPPMRPPNLRRKSRESLSTGVSLDSDVKSDADSGTRKERQLSVSLRPSNIIPSITRRLGLGFGIKSKKNEDASAATTDNEDMDQNRRSRVSSAGTTSSLHERAPIPPRLVIDRHSRGHIPVTIGSHNRSIDRQADDSSISSESSMGLVSIDSSSDSDSDIDLDGHNFGFTQGILQTPVGTVSRSYHGDSHLLDDHNSEPGSADSSNAQIDLMMGSPLQNLHPSMRLSQHLPSSMTDSEGSVLKSFRRHSQYRLGRDSSAEDDDVESHGPDLHFGHSDTGSDVEGLSNVNSQDAAEYVRSVIAANSRASNELSHEDSIASTSTMPQQSLNKTSSMESALGTNLPLSGKPTATPGAAAGPQENITLWKAISNILMTPGVSQLFQIGLDLVYPLSPSEHLIAGSPVIVREEEPSSIIAFTLLDSEFRKKVHEMFEEARFSSDKVSHGGNASGRSSRNSTGPLDKHGRSPSPVNEFSKAPPPRSDDEVIERIMLHSPGHYINFKRTAGQMKITCQVFYAAQFEALRRCNGCEDSYIESLSRCNPYVAKGGKSGSAFLRTRDERFIIKEISIAEADAFLKFAPFYFEHMFWNWTYREERPTVLAKIFGFCRVSFHNKATGKKLKNMNVVIMENLFYGRKCSRHFDLKGSERNRMADETVANAVLLDENMLMYIRDNPICIRQQTKRHLHAAIWNDTLFLSKMNVMDYSLLVGFDDASKELVVGIIDFIRTFTWDKQLESWVKEAGILGGGGKGPTIVSPKQYKNRFREAMKRYFMMVPDKFYVPFDDGE